MFDTKTLQEGVRGHGKCSLRIKPKDKPVVRRRNGNSGTATPSLAKAGFGRHERSRSRHRGRAPSRSKTGRLPSHHPEQMRQPQ
jgi:hypothetical protein